MTRNREAILFFPSETDFILLNLRVPYSTMFFDLEIGVDKAIIAILEEVNDSIH
jgi:hypothetical protein